MTCPHLLRVSWPSHCVGASQICYEIQVFERQMWVSCQCRLEVFLEEVVAAKIQTRALRFLGRRFQELLGKEVELANSSDSIQQNYLHAQSDVENYALPPRAPGVIVRYQVAVVGCLHQTKRAWLVGDRCGYDVKPLSLQKRLAWWSFRGFVAQRPEKDGPTTFRTQTYRVGRDRNHDHHEATPNNATKPNPQDKQKTEPTKPGTGKIVMKKGWLGKAGWNLAAGLCVHEVQ